MAVRTGRRRTEHTLRAWRVSSAKHAFPMAEWDDPANDVLLECPMTGRDPMPAVADVAYARHESGFTFGECAADLQNLRAVLPRHQARSLEPFKVVVAIGDVFLEASYAEGGPTSSGLPDEYYLSRRIAETYRVSGTPQLGVLGVVRLAPLPDRFDGLLRRLQAVPILQQGFAGAVTLGVVGEDCFVALLARASDATDACQRSVDGLRLAGVEAIEWWLQPLPDDLADLHTVLAEMRRRQ